MRSSAPESRVQDLVLPTSSSSAVYLFRPGIQKKRGGRDGRNQKKGANFGYARRSLVGFAMSFLQVGKPMLLRWVLQRSELYSRVCGIGEDNTDIVMYVLSTLRVNVLAEESLVPPGIRGVLFGSAKLEQLSLISGNLDAGKQLNLLIKCWSWSALIQKID